MKHYIITRMGLGRRDDAFYRDHIALCALTLARSLAAQTSKDFIWAVTIDARAPAWVEARIRTLAPGVTTVVWRNDPLEHGFRAVDKAWLAYAPRYITSRVDDDDLLHRDFVARAQAELRDAPVPGAHSFPDGADLSADRLTRSHFPWIGAGLSVLSDRAFRTHAYRHNHNRVGAAITAEGGRAILSETAFPMWLRTWRPGSDSSEARGLRAGSGADLVLDWADYGTDAAGIAALRLRLQEPVPRLEGVWSEAPASRLALKSHLIEKIRSARAAGAAPDEVEMLARIMYLI